MIHNLEFEELISKLFEYEHLDVVVQKEEDATIVINDDIYTFENDYDFDTCILPRFIISFLSLDKMKVRKLLFNNLGNIVIEKNNRKLLFKNVSVDDIALIDNLDNAINGLRENTDVINGYEEYALYQIMNNYYRYIKNNDLEFIANINEINMSIINNHKDELEVFKELSNNNSLYNTEEFINEIVNNKNKENKYKRIIENERYNITEGDHNMARKSEKESFANIINNPIEGEDIFVDEEDIDVLRLGAVEQAKMLIEVMKERDSIKKDAEDFAKTILEKQKERRQIIKAAEEQARRIIVLEKENEELKRLAEENARIIFDKDLQEDKLLKKDASEYAKIIYAKQEERRSLLNAAEEQAKRIIELEKENAELKRLAEENAKNLFNRENKLRNEVRLREIDSNVPVKESDIDKLYNLLNALTAVENLDFAVNRPTVLQELINLEQKIETYISTHNVVAKEDNEEPIVTEIEDKKTNKELLDIIRNAYVESHNYEKEGRHSVINIVQEFDMINVTIYSVKNDTDDVLTSVYFDKYLFDDATIQELCSIYSTGAIIVASKTDNLPGGLQDYLVIDSQDNAIKFMNCDKSITEKAKAYL